MPKEIKGNSKILLLSAGIYLQINYCEKNRPPIYEIDFAHQTSFEWISLKMPATFSQKYNNLSLCYKIEDSSGSEPLTDVEILITQRKRIGEDKEVFILPSGYKIINNNPIAHSYLIYKRMKSLFQQTYKPILLEKYPENNKINTSMLSIFCFPQGIHLSKQLKGFISFNFILTQQNGNRIYANCLSFKQSLDKSIRNNLNLNQSEKIYYQKAICLLSRHRYTDQFSECLKHLYRLSMSKNDVPFHKVVMSFVNNMVLPKEVGVNGLSYSYMGSNINFDTNPTYPIISEKAIYCVFKFLPLSAIISIFQGILLEKKIIFVSQSKTILGFTIEAFLSFLFPFRWEHVLIPILPSILKEYITAPVPLIVGINPMMVDHSIESDSIIVQMDEGIVLNDEDLPPLPDKLEKQLRKRLQMYEIYDENDVKEYLQNPQSTYIFKMQEVQHPEFQGCQVRDCFYEFMLTLMKNYKKFWKVQKYKDTKQNSSLGLTEPQLLNDIFKVQDFLSDLGMNKVGSFGYKFTQGTIFTSFIERRHQFTQDFELKFFDDCLDRKKSNKNAKLIEKISNIRYIVAKHPQPEFMKNVYIYQKFPSILGKESIKQQDIALEIDLPQDFNSKNQQAYEQEIQKKKYIAKQPNRPTNAYNLNHSQLRQSGSQIKSQSHSNSKNIQTPQKIRFSGDQRQFQSQFRLKQQNQLDFLKGQNKQLQILIKDSSNKIQYLQKSLDAQRSQKMQLQTKCQEMSKQFQHLKKQLKNSNQSKPKQKFQGNEGFIGSQKVSKKFLIDKQSQYQYREEQIIGVKSQDKQQLARLMTIINQLRNTNEELQQKLSINDLQLNKQVFQNELARRQINKLNENIGYFNQQLKQAEISLQEKQHSLEEFRERFLYHKKK